MIKKTIDLKYISGINPSFFSDSILQQLHALSSSVYKHYLHNIDNYFTAIFIVSGIAFDAL